MGINFKYSTPDLTDNHSSTDELAKKFHQTISREDIGFYRMTDNNQLIDSTLNILEKIKSKKHFVQVGIGGSALGPQMLVSALGNNKEKTFSLLDNTDADHLTDVLGKIDLKESVFYVVSKSGGTAETIACYSIVRNMLKDLGVKEEDFSNYFVFCTDPTSGQMREHVDKNNYLCLEVPSDVGGRFSVLSPVGLLPAAFMGIDIQKLYSGANEYKKVMEDDLYKLANTTLALKEKCPETVFMPYSSKLKDLSFWFIQLWAESLGKDGKGLTPIPAYGATDQHSQMQLFMEGPNNKLILLLHIKNKKNNYQLDSGLELSSANKLKAYSLNELLEAEYNGTLKALEENKRNVVSIEIDELNEEILASLVLFFESLTAIVGESLLIDPFNQPGVEKGKIYAFEYLNSLRK